MIRKLLLKISILGIISCLLSTAIIPNTISEQNPTNYDNLEIELKGGFGLSANIKNNGDIDLFEIEWSINFGSLVKVGNYSNDIISHLPSGDEIKIKSGFILGFGVCEVKVIAGDSSIIQNCIVIGMIVLLKSVPNDFIKNPDSIVYYTFGDAKTLDPADAYDSASAEAIFSIYEGLITYNKDDLDTFYPSLATSWDVSEDSKTWTFNLREGVKFSNGNDFTAEDVKYSFDRVLTMNSPESGVAWILQQSMDLNSTVIIDDCTIEINLIEPYGGFLSTIAYTVGFIVDKDYVEEHGGVIADTENEYLKLNPMGTGPYMLDQWTRNTEMVLVQNPDYWGGWEGKHVETVVIKYANEAATRILALKNGDADIAVIPNENLEDLEDDDGIIIIPYDSFDLVMAMMNTRLEINEYLAEKEVRRALSFAFNYQSAIDDAYVGYMSRVAGAIPQGMPYYDTQNNGEPYYDYDLEKAAEILDDAGFTLNEDEQRFDGTIIRIFYNAGNTERYKMALSFQEELNKIGILSSVIAENWPGLLHRIYATDDWDIIFIGWGPDYNDPDDYVFPLVASMSVGGDTYNTGWKNDTVNEYLLEAKYSADPEVRWNAYKNAFDIYIHDPSMIYIGQRQFIRPKRDWIQGYYYNPVRDWYWYDNYKGYG